MPVVKCYFVFDNLSPSNIPNTWRKNVTLTNKCGKF